MWLFGVNWLFHCQLATYTYPRPFIQLLVKPERAICTVWYFEKRPHEPTQWNCYWHHRSAFAPHGFASGVALKLVLTSRVKRIAIRMERTLSLIYLFKQQPVHRGLQQTKWIKSQTTCTWESEYSKLICCHWHMHPTFVLLVYQLPKTEQLFVRQMWHTYYLSPCAQSLIPSGWTWRWRKLSLMMTHFWCVQYLLLHWIVTPTS